MAFDLGTLIARIVADADQYFNVLNQAQSALQRTATNMERIGRKMSLAITAPLALIGGASLREFGTFDEEITKALSVVRNTTPQMRQQFEDLAKQMATRFPFAASQMAGALHELMLAGMSTEQSMASLGKIAEFATSGSFKNLNSVSLMLVHTQNALKMNSDDTQIHIHNLTRIMDVLNTTAAETATTVEELSMALKTKAAAAIDFYNIGLERGVALLGAMSAQGVVGQLAGERLDILMREIFAAPRRRPEGWRTLGVDVPQTGADIVNALRALSLEMQGLDDRSRANLLWSLGFQDRSSAAIRAILPMADAIDELTEMNERMGITTEFADARIGAFTNQMKLLWNVVKNAGLAIADILAPWIEKLSNFLKPIIQWFTELDRTTRKWIVGIGVAVGILGPLILGIGTAMSLAAFAVTGLGIAISGLTTVISAIASPVGIVVGLIASISAAGIAVALWYKSLVQGSLAWKTFMETLKKGWEAIKSRFKPILVGLVLIFKNMIVPAFRKLQETVGEALRNALNQIHASLSVLFSTLKESGVLDLLEKLAKAFAFLVVFGLIGVIKSLEVLIPLLIRIGAFGWTILIQFVTAMVEVVSTFISKLRELSPLLDAFTNKLNSFGMAFRMAAIAAGFATKAAAEVQMPEIPIIPEKQDQPVAALGMLPDLRAAIEDRILAAQREIEILNAETEKEKELLGIRHQILDLIKENEGRHHQLIRNLAIELLEVRRITEEQERQNEILEARKEFLEDMQRLAENIKESIKDPFQRLEEFRSQLQELGELDLLTDIEIGIAFDMRKEDLVKELERLVPEMEDEVRQRGVFEFGLSEEQKGLMRLMAGVGAGDQADQKEEEKEIVRLNGVLVELTRRAMVAIEEINRDRRTRGLVEIVIETAVP